MAEAVAQPFAAGPPAEGDAAAAANDRTSVAQTVIHPILVAGGPMDDVPRGPVDNAVGAYKVYYEDFAEQAADGQIETMGFTVTAINSPTSATEVVTGLTQSLLINPGSKAEKARTLGVEIIDEAEFLRRLGKGN